MYHKAQAGDVAVIYSEADEVLLDIHGPTWATEENLSTKSLRKIKNYSF